MGPRILCVDDDRNLCEILARALQLEGFEVSLAHDGDAAVAAVRQQVPDLVLLDLLLPKRDGFEVLEALRAEAASAETPVVLLSGCSRTPTYRERAERLRATEFLVKPVPLDLLVETMRKCVGIAAPLRVDAGAARVAGSAGPGAVATDRVLAGDLREMPFPALLHHLHGLRTSGVLYLESGKKKKAIQVRDGRPVAVKSNLVDECLGNRLFRNERITRPELDESLRRRREGEGLQGEILVGMRLLSEKELAEALFEQANEKLFEIFGWRAGAFRFELGARLDSANALPLERSPANLILDGVRTRFPLDVIDAHLAALSSCYLAPNESPFYQFQDVDLDPGEDFLLHALDGRVRVGDLGEQGEATRRTLYGLLITGLLEPRGKAIAEPAPRVRAAANAAPAPRPATDHDAEAAQRAELTAIAERLRGRGFFEILGVSEKATDDDVRRAYVELAKRTHPDRFAGSSDAVRLLAEEIFGLVSRAYETLADTSRRFAYRMERAGGARAAADLEEGHRALAAEQQFQQGEAKLRRREFAEAAKCFESAAKLYPEEGEYLAHYGYALHLSTPDDPERLLTALRAVKRGVKLAPERDVPLLLLGKLYLAAGKIDRAERALAKAVEIRPQSVDALRELRLIHMRREKEKGVLGRLFRR